MIDCLHFTHGPVSDHLGGFRVCQRDGGRSERRNDGLISPQNFHGNFHLNYLHNIMHYSFPYFNLMAECRIFWLIFILLGTILIFVIKPTKGKFLPIFICLLITSLFPFSMFYNTAFAAGNDFHSFFDQSYDRAMLPAITLVVFLGILIIGLLSLPAN